MGPQKLKDEFQLGELLEKIVLIKDIKTAQELLFTLICSNDQIQKALNLCITQHDGQFRKSGEPYSIHPILVACIVAFLGEEQDMVISALLHDVVEDTDYTLYQIEENFGKNVAKIVESLTKIVSIRESKFVPSTDKSHEKLHSSALTFRRMLLIAIEDVRGLVVKLCDRLHNMVTLEALRPDKQKRIAEETLVVDAPIAHRLGISSVKNLLEDLSFKYILPDEYNKIDKYMNDHKEQLWATLRKFSVKISNLLIQNGFDENKFQIQTRTKHYYSVYLKMQRKGISIQEVLDLLAVRIIVENTMDCYKILGLIHTNFNPLISRFKDYIALPKQNRYQTIHTTIFDESMIIEAQIRTFDMHRISEYGVAAHWKYKEDGYSNPNLEWMNDIKMQDSDSETPEDLYEYAKQSLYSEDIAVYSPKGGIFTLPRGATTLDFAYEIHSQVGLKAIEAYVNRVKVPLLTELKNGDIVHIITGSTTHYRCSWLNAVKTGKARAIIKAACKQQLREINTQVAFKILCGIFGVNQKNISTWLENENLSKKIARIANDSIYLQNIVNILKKYPRKLLSFTNKYEVKKQKFDNIVVYSNHTINEVQFDYCCTPKRGDDIIGFRNSHNVTVHHKFCERAGNLMKNGEEMIFVKWTRNAPHRYKIILNLENKRGSLAQFLSYLARLQVDLVAININENSDLSSDYFEMIVELNENLNQDSVKDKLKNQYKIVEFISLDDAYRGN